MKMWIVLVVLFLYALADGSILYGNAVPHSFFVTPDGRQNCLIVVGEKADAADIIEASQLAAVIGRLSSRRTEIPVVEEVGVSYTDVKAGTCVTVTPSALQTLWYFDDFGVYGNGNGRYDLWESHEEIQVYSEDIPEYDPLLGVYKGNGYLDFSTISPSSQPLKRVIVP